MRSFLARLPWTKLIVRREGQRGSSTALCFVTGTVSFVLVGCGGITGWIHSESSAQNPLPITMPSPIPESRTANIVMRSVGPTLSQATATTNIELSAPLNMQAGDVEIAQVWTGNGGSLADIAPPAGWVLIRSDSTYDSAFYIPSNYSAHSLFYKVATDNEPTTYIFMTSLSSNHAGGAIIAYSGVNNSTPIDQASCNSGVGEPTYASVAAPSITAAKRGEVILDLGATTNMSIPEQPVANQLTEEIGYNPNIYVGDFIYDMSLPTAGATPDLSFFTGGYQTYAACQVAIRPASSAVNLRNVGPITLRKSIQLAIAD